MDTAAPGRVLVVAPDCRLPANQNQQQTEEHGCYGCARITRIENLSAFTSPNSPMTRFSVFPVPVTSPHATPFLRKVRLTKNLDPTKSGVAAFSVPRHWDCDFASGTFVLKQMWKDRSAAAYTHSAGPVKPAPAGDAESRLVARSCQLPSTSCVRVSSCGWF